MKIALCCIGRQENRYAIEFVEYYKKLGIDKIFIYDNNYGDEEHFEEVLQPYIDEGLVEITNFRDKSVCQLEAYQNCYDKHGNEYDWIAFFDFDEYLSFENNENIKEFLSDDIFNKYQCIHINWMVYGDSDNIKYENKPLIERFTKPMNYNNCVGYSFPENNHIKSIVRGGIDKFKWIYNPHTPNCNLMCCDALGKQCDDSAFKPYSFDRCYIKHFYTKSIEEFFTLKERRQRPDRLHTQKINYNDCFKRFFLINQKTEEKIKYLEEIGVISENNLDIFICAHKDFKIPVNNPIYKVIDARKIDKGEYILEDDFYSEILQFFYINKNVELKPYVGVCHYRRYFSFMDEVPNMDDLFKEFDAIVAKPIKYETNIKVQYFSCHNIEDLYIIGGILADKYPEYCNAWHYFLNGNIFFPYNMFIMKREDFKEYINFIQDVLNEYVKIVGTDIIKRIGNNVEKYLKDFYPNNTIEYQYRIGGYLAERLTNVFIIKKFTKLKAYSIIITEKKY